MSIWDELEDVQRRLNDLETRLVYLEDYLHTRLKKEADRARGRP